MNGGRGASLHSGVAADLGFEDELVIEAHGAFRNGDGVRDHSVRAHDVVVRLCVLPDLSVGVHTLHTDKGALRRVVVGFAVPVIDRRSIETKGPIAGGNGGRELSTGAGGEEGGAGVWRHGIAELVNALQAGEVALRLEALR